MRQERQRVVLRWVSQGNEWLVRRLRYWYAQAFYTDYEVFISGTCAILKLRPGDRLIKALPYANKSVVVLKEPYMASIHGMPGYYVRVAHPKRKSLTSL